MTKRGSVCRCTKGSIFTHCWKHMDYLKQNHRQLQLILVKDDGVSKLVDPICYHSMVGGSLLYAAITTRPDIAQAVGTMPKFNSCPTEAHLIAVKRIFRYPKGTINLGLRYERSADDSQIGFSDTDWARDMDDRHSTTGTYLSCLEELSAGSAGSN